MELHIHGFGMATRNRHTHNRGGDLYIVISQNLTSLIQQFHLFGSVTVVGEITTVGEEVHVDGMRIGGFARLTGTFAHQLIHGLLARARDRLVGRHHQSLDFETLM